MLAIPEVRGDRLELNALVRGSRTRPYTVIVEMEFDSEHALQTEVDGRKKELVAGLLGEGAQQNLQLTQADLNHLFDPL